MEHPSDTDAEAESSEGPGPDPADERPDEAELAGAVEPEPGQTVWRAGHERVVSDATEPPGPYGPENGTTRPAADREHRTTRGHAAADDQGING